MIIYYVDCYQEVVAVFTDPDKLVEWFKKAQAEGAYDIRELTVSVLPADPSTTLFAYSWFDDLGLQGELMDTSGVVHPSAEATDVPFAAEVEKAAEALVQKLSEL
jgi:hypothetical protein